MSAKKYKSKEDTPNVIEAIQFDGTNEPEIDEWATTQFGARVLVDQELEVLVVKTREGRLVGKVDDWVMVSPYGDLTICTPDVFEACYEPAP